LVIVVRWRADEPAARETGQSSFRARQNPYRNGTAHIVRSRQIRQIEQEKGVRLTSWIGKRGQPPESGTFRILASSIRPGTAGGFQLLVTEME